MPPSKRRVVVAIRACDRVGSFPELQPRSRVEIDKTGHLKELEGDGRWKEAHCCGTSSLRGAQVHLVAHALPAPRRGRWSDTVVARG